MNRGFYTIMAAQFFSSLADNALLIAAIALLAEMHSPAWMTPLLKLFSCFLCAAGGFVGAFADAFQGQGHVDHQHDQDRWLLPHVLYRASRWLPWWSGFGAAAYSPAKYGSSPNSCRRKNGGRQRLDRGAHGGFHHHGYSPGRSAGQSKISAVILSFDFPMIDLPIDTPDRSGAVHHLLHLHRRRPLQFLHSRYRCPLRAPGTQPHPPHRRFRRLLHHPVEGQAGPDLAGRDHALLGRGATLQFIVLKWAKVTAHAPGQGRHPAGHRRRGRGPGLRSPPPASCR
jgi:hypothetical protein